MTGFLRKSFTPQIDTPAPPPPPDPVTNPDTQAAVLQKTDEEQQRAKKGRASNILTSQLGDTTQVSNSKRVLLGS